MYINAAPTRMRPKWLRVDRAIPLAWLTVSTAIVSTSVPATVVRSGARDIRASPESRSRMLQRRSGSVFGPGGLFDDESVDGAPSRDRRHHRRHPHAGQSDHAACAAID